MSSPQQDQTTLSMMDAIDPPQKSAMKSSGAFISSLIIIVVTAALALGLLVTATDTQQATQESNLEKRMMAVVTSQANIIQNLIDAQIRVGLEQTSNPLVQIVLSEQTSQDSGPLVLRLQDSFDVFRQKNQLHSSFILQTDLTTFLGSSKESEVSTDLFRTFLTSNSNLSAATVLPVRIEKARVLLDIVHPIDAFQKEQHQGTARKVGYLITTSDITNIFANALKTTLDADTSASALVISTPSGARFLLDNGSVQSGAAGKLTQSLPLQKTTSAISGSKPVYLLSNNLPGSNLSVIRETDEKVIRTEVDRFRFFGSILAILATLVVAAVTMILRFRQRSVRHKELATQYQEFASKLQFQSQFIDTINGAIPEIVMLKDQNDRVVYANPAAKSVLNHKGEEVIGRTVTSMLSKDVAQWLQKLDALAMSENQAVSEKLSLTRQNNENHFIVSASPFLIEGDTENTYTLNVARNITDIIKSQEARMRSTEKTVMALISIIERRDPFLKGHSKQLADLAVSIGKQMELKEDQLQALKYAGSLSQVGKSFIPKELLTKTARLTDTEIQEMKRHIHYTIDTVQQLELSPIVTNAISQMYERLDGSGYPEGISGDRICLEARILAIADVLIARTSDRSYRLAIPAEEAMQVLLENTERYDHGVVEALIAYSKTDDGRDILKMGSASSA